MTLFTATNITNEINQVASKLFGELSGETIRKLGIHTSRVVQNNDCRQLDLFNLDRYEKFEKLDKV